MYERRNDRAVALSSVVNRFLLLEDLNNDGLTDIVAGGDDGNRQTKSPIYVFISQGDGSLLDRTSDYIEGTAEACSPVAAVGDVNNDGVLDIVVYDRGNTENPQHPNGGFVGEAPFVMLSGASSGRRWRVETKLAEAYEALTGDPKVHSTAVALGDVDGDGDLDIVAESQGGYQMIRTHIVINNGNDTWSPDIQTFGARLPIEINQGYPATYAHRHASEVFADLDHDGHVDLVMGQLRRINNDQGNLFSKVCWNPGNGYYDSGNVTHLRYVPWKDGYTYAKSLTVVDLDNDGWEDIILGHERGNNATLNNGNTGLYLQFLRNLGNRSFADVTEAYFPNLLLCWPSRRLAMGRTTTWPN